MAADESGGTPTLATLKDLISLMRDMGVSELEIPGQARIVLGAVVSALRESTQQQADFDEAKKVADKGKVGKDGLTKQEQEDLYGRVIDAE